MLAKLFPSQGKAFFDFFEQHAQLTVEAAKLLHTMLSVPGDLGAQARRIKEVEHEGDHVTHRAIETLHKTFVTPFDRGDIHRLISRLDDVLDLVDATSERVWLYKLEARDSDAVQLAEVLVHAVIQVHRAMGCLRNMRDRDALLRICMEINRYENEGDTLLRSGLARLFSGNRDPVSIIKWKDVYDFLENAVDRCEDVANVLEGVALEYT